MYFMSRPGHSLLLTSTFQNFFLLRKCTTFCSLKAWGFVVLKDSSAQNHCSCTRTRGAPVSPRMTQRWWPNRKPVYPETAKPKIVADCNQHYSHQNTQNQLSGTRDIITEVCINLAHATTKRKRKEKASNGRRWVWGPNSEVQRDLHSC